MTNLADKIDALAPPGRGMVGKIAVVGIRAESGEVRAEIVEDTKAPTLGAFVRAHANPGATVVTDTHGGYIGLAAASYRRSAKKSFKLASRRWAPHWLPSAGARLMS